MRGERGGVRDEGREVREEGGGLGLKEEGRCTYEGVGVREEG